MIVKNAGWMWHRKYVDWSKRELNGIHGNGQTPVNFANQSAVYALYDCNNVCIYIGQAGSGDNSALYDRLKAHALNDRLFCLWERFSWFGFYTADAMKEKEWDSQWEINTDIKNIMNVMEAVAINVSRPNYNMSWGNLCLPDEDWYYQEEEHLEMSAPPPRSRY